MKLLLVDLSAIFHRAWHSTADQELGNAFDSTVKKVRWLASSGYDGVAVCIDSPPYDRKKISPDYKANREKPDPGLVEQLHRVKSRLAADGFPIWGSPGAEADDVIASACSWAMLNKHDVHIASADKDLMALVADSILGSASIQLRSTATDDIYDSAKVVEKFGVAPMRMPDYLALVGDKSDNVAGVPGVGAVKAADLVNRYESVPQLIAALRSGHTVSTPAIQSALSTAALDGSLELALQLVSLRYDVTGIDWSAALKPREEKPLKDSEVTDADFTEEQPAAQQQEQEGQPSQAIPSQAIEARQEAPQASALAVVAPSYATALEPRSFNEAWVMAKVAVNSRSFGVTNNEQALAMIIRGRALGLDSVTSLSAFHVIKNKMTLSATMIEGMVMRSECCEYFYVEESTPTKCTWVTKRRGQPEQRHTWVIGDAQSLGLTGLDQWKKQPRTMLRHRCATDFARMVYPDVVAGLYAAEEMEDAA